MNRGLSLFLSTLFAVTGTAKAEDGIASHYTRSSGSKVACGGELNESALTAAHRTLPCGACSSREQTERSLNHSHD